MATVPKVCVTCICIWQVELRPGEPWSAAVTVKAYSARSIHLRGEAALSSPVVGLRVKRSALAPAQVTFNTKKCSFEHPFKIRSHFKCAFGIKITDSKYTFHKFYVMVFSSWFFKYLI